METLFVAGAGQMGSGIAQVCAAAGHRVLLYDLDTEFVKQGIAGITRQLDRSVDKGRLSVGDRDAVLDRIEGTDDLCRASEADFAIEAIIEDIGAKTALFSELDRVCDEGVVLATNTSSLSVTALAAVTSRPDRVVGLHFMNPVPVMKLVEVIKGLPTSDQTFQRAWELVVALGKEPVAVADYPGFVINRLLIPMINEAVGCLQESVASREDIDRVMTLGAGHPLGPLALADLIGLDVVLAIMETLHHGFKDSRYRPNPLLVKMVEAGRLGRKTGQGFYEYGR